jgi:hypothetical protein
MGASCGRYQVHLFLSFSSFRSSSTVFRLTVLFHFIDSRLHSLNEGSAECQALTYNKELRSATVARSMCHPITHGGVTCCVALPGTRCEQLSRITPPPHVQHDLCSGRTRFESHDRHLFYFTRPSHTYAVLDFSHTVLGYITYGVEPVSSNIVKLNAAPNPHPLEVASRLRVTTSYVKTFVRTEKTPFLATHSLPACRYVSSLSIKIAVAVIVVVKVKLSLYGGVEV